MMNGNFFRHCKRLIFCLLILGFSSTALFSQKKLSGNLNQPAAHVISIPASDRVIVDDVTGFSAPDTILVIQMQGVGITTPTTGYGYIQSIFGQPGLHEFMIIQSVNGGTNEIVFRNNLLNTYDPKGNIQIVRVPYYNNATVTGKLFCNPWNSTTKKGGVLALVIGRTLTLNADIDVSNCGFTGGKDTIGIGRCAMVVPTTILDYYARSFTNAGFKGEGIAIHDDFGTLLAPSHSKGQGPNFTSGGGGNGRFSGGGGGSNHGAGGIGGSEDNACTAPQSGGLGGFKSEQPSFPSFINRIFFGGGGGASTSLTGLSPSGGNGGGIVLIVSDTIIGNGGNIIANGGEGGTAVLTGGSGGGGGGGSIALSLQSYGSTPLTFYALGGNGGDNPGGFGEGAGGGGGFLYVSNSTTGNITSVLSGGLPGDYPSSATAGGTGEQRVGFKAVLNGFLFNSISSSVTGNQIDSVCSNMIPPKLNGTIPVGGTGPYTYMWEKSYDQSVWTTIVNDPDPTNYTPAIIETATVWFRRTITDNSPTPLVDISKSVKIIVQPYIKNNIVGNSDTICFAQNPPAFTSKATLQDGNGKYSFNWEVSLNNSLYANPANSHNAEGYTPPPALTQTSWYRRTVTSGRCIDSTAIAKITVLDTIANNKILNSPPDICYGMTFTNLIGSSTSTSPDPLKGGDNSYIFKWESNINGSGWGTAPGISNGTGYNPIELPQRTPFNQYIFRRIVYSGSDNVCVSTSDTVLLKDFPVITNNTIASVPPICSGTVPANIIGSKPPTLAGGNTVYIYSWQDSSKFHTWTLISGATGADYQPPGLTDTTSYRRSVLSPDIATGCFDISNSIKIIVHKPILNNSISVSGGGTTETICNNQQPGTFQGTTATGGTGIAGSYIYQWKSSPDNSVFTPVATAGTGVNYSPPQLTATTYYQRQVTSGACIVNSNSITETVLPVITNNIISGNPKVCYSLVPAAITGATLSGGSGTYKYFWWQSTDGGANWVAASGTNTSSSYQPPALFNAIKYERTVTSGLNDCCTSTSNVFDIGINPLPASTINAGPDTIIYSIEKIYHMNAIQPLTGETGVWDVLDNGTSSIDDTTKYNTTVRNLSVGNNSFLWTVSRGLCKLSDSVTVELLKDFIPQGFSPNGDAYNNTFIIEGLNLDDNYVDLSIVNGAGTEVFKTSNRDNQKWSDWDGKNSKGLDLSEGTYYYMLKVTSKQSNGPVFKKSGFIVLKRY
jgi:gliding motility-associated-like protein